MRVDQLHEYFISLMPEKAKASDKFYEGIWDPANYTGQNAGAAKT